MRKKLDIDDFFDMVESMDEKMLTVADLVELSGFSRGHFYKWFRDQTGISVGMYLHRLRMRHAVSDIASGKYIRDVAISCGFTTESGFIFLFRKEYGMKPSEYRQAFHKLKRLPLRCVII